MNPDIENIIYEYQEVFKMQGSRFASGNICKKLQLIIVTKQLFEKNEWVGVN